MLKMMSPSDQPNPMGNKIELSNNIINNNFNKQLPLRDYQQECINNIFKLFKEGKNRQIISLPVAAGKTVIFSHLIEEFGQKTLVLVHTNELQQQAVDKIKMISPNADVGVVNQDCKEFDKDIIVCSIQSAIRDNNLVELIKANIKLIICDEAHHYATLSARRVLTNLGFDKNISNEKLLCGFTATPFRYKSKYGLGEVFEYIAYERSIKQMIEDSWLVEPKAIKILNDLDLSAVQTTGGDFEAASLAEVLDTPDMHQLVVDSYLQNGRGRKTIAFGCTVKHAINLSKCFNENNIKADVIYGDMPKADREEVLGRYANGDIEALCNCSVLTEGFDAPQTSCVIIARPTQSIGLFMQMCGRALRLYPKKDDALILDFSSKTHELSSVTLLLEDAKNIKQIQKEKAQLEFIQSLPRNLNPKLKSALKRNINLLSEEFKWEKQTSGYALKSSKDCYLKIIPENERFSVVFDKKNSIEIIAQNLSFDYAFAAADTFAKENRRLFILSDKNAAWNNEPISEGQINTLHKFRYRSGLDHLSKGQASVIIDFLIKSN